MLHAQSAPAFELPKGSKVVLGVYNNKEIVWDIGNNNNSGNYVLMSSKPLEEKGTAIYDASVPMSSSVVIVSDREQFRVNEYSGSTGNSYCPIKPLTDKIDNISLNSKETNIMNRNPFLPNMHEVKDGGSLGLALSDRAFTTGGGYWVAGYITDGNTWHPSRYFNVIQGSADMSTSGYATMYDYDTSDTIPLNNKIILTSCLYNRGSSAVYFLRPYAILTKNKVNFAANISYSDGN